MKGEYQSFDIARVREAEGQTTFVCPENQNYLIQLRPGSTVVINGEVIKNKAIVANFKDFHFTTDDPVVIDLLRKSKAMKDGSIQELSLVRARNHDAEVASAAKTLAEKPEVLKAALAQLKQGKAVAPQTA